MPERTREALLRQVRALERRVAELEASAVDQARAAGAIEKESEAWQHALQKSEATASALFDSASEGILLVDTSGRIVLANRGARRMFGYERDELTGSRLEILLPERARESHARHLAGYFAEPRVRPMGTGFDLAARRRDGSEFPVEISLNWVESDEGPVAMAFVTDITQRKRAEAELERQREVLFQSEKLAALGRLAAGIAHEVNNPLAIISARIEVMLLEAEDRGLSWLAPDLEVLHRNTQRVAQIARGLRSFARQTPGERSPVNLNAVVRGTLQLMERPLATDGIRVAVDLDGSLPLIRGNADELHQVLLNLLANAREAMGGRGEIAIATSRGEDAGAVRLVVTDTGPGIAPEDLPKVFDPFFTTKADGTGLGLSLSHGIVRAHQGTIDVQSSPGRGTTFILAFPLPASP
jgi:PAS domain S-box-containing protein